MSSRLGPVRFRKLRLLSFQQHLHRSRAGRWLLGVLVGFVLLVGIVIYIREIHFDGYQGEDLPESLSWLNNDADAWALGGGAFDGSTSGDKQNGGSSYSQSRADVDTDTDADVDADRDWNSWDLLGPSSKWRNALRYQIDLTALSPEQRNQWIVRLTRRLARSLARASEANSSRQTRHNLQIDLAILLIAEGRFDDAKRIIFNVPQTRASDASVQYTLGLLLRKTKSASQAINIWQDALAALHKNRASSRSGLQDGTRQGTHKGTHKGSHRGAQAIWDERLIRLELGKEYHAQGRYRHALLQFKKVRKLDQHLGSEPSSFSTGLFLASAKTYEAMGEKNSATVLYQIVLQSEAATATQRKTAAKELATTQIAAGKWQEARVLVRRVRSWHPDDVEIILLQNRIRLLASPNGFRGAANQERAETISGDWAYFGSLDEAEDQAYLREQAIQDLNELVSSSSLRSQALLSQAYNLLGVAHQQNGDIQLALEAYEYALEFDPGNQEAYENSRIVRSR